MRVKVCQNCLSTGLFTPSLSQGSVPGVAELQGVYACSNCGWKGVPVEVEEKKLKLLASKKRKR